MDSCRYLEDTDDSKNKTNKMGSTLNIPQETIILQDEERPILQYNPEPGSELILKGHLQVLRFIHNIIFLQQRSIFKTFSM
jgi:hypothetical protein